MATTDLKLDVPGTLTKPGPIGRLVRLGFGYLCTHYVYELWTVRDVLVSEEGSIRPVLWNGIIIALILVSYIINIGFSRSWKKWPAIVSVLILLAAAGVNYIQYGIIQGHISAIVLYVWLLYIFSHLGLAFLVSAIIATPGCEMRAFHHLYSLLTGNQTKEHHCPIGPLQAIDDWEAKYRK
jgi:hypothetical protein